MHDTENTRPPLSYARMDVERRIGFPSGQFTQPGAVLPLVLAIILSVGFYAAVTPFAPKAVVESFTARGWVPYAIVFLSWWALMILLVKHAKVRLQARALRHSILPADPSFVLSVRSVDEVLDRLYDLADEPTHFLLYNRVQFALSNLRNIGRIGDVDEILRSRAENDEAAAEASYTVVRGLIWGIPVLGFIGTVIGLSVAIGSFGAVLQEGGELEQLKPALQQVTAGLATAFETTLQALVAALVIQLLSTFVRRGEDQMLVRFNDYCDRHVVAKLRIERPEDEPS